MARSPASAIGHARTDELITLLNDMGVVWQIKPVLKEGSWAWAIIIIMKYGTKEIRQMVTSRKLESAKANILLVIARNMYKKLFNREWTVSE